MLLELWSPAIPQANTAEKHIQFRSGLNVVLGEKGASNSIGKSTSLLILDFVYGGNSYAKSDAVKHLDNHEIFFAFKFNEEVFRFSRSTDKPNEIKKYSDTYQSVETILDHSEYVHFLALKYQFIENEAVFRTAISSHFRIAEKSNLKTKDPLEPPFPSSKEKNLISLIQLFDRYKKLEEVNNTLATNKKKLNYFEYLHKEIKKIPQSSAKIAQYEQRIIQLQSKRFQLESNQSKIPDATDRKIYQEKKLLEDKINNTKLQLKIINERKRILDSSDHLESFISSDELEEFANFFPGVNLKLLIQIESFHQKLFTLLEEDFQYEKTLVQKESINLTEELSTLYQQLDNLPIKTIYATDFIDEIIKIEKEIDSLQRKIDLWKEWHSSKNLKIELNRTKETLYTSIIQDIQDSLNNELSQLNNKIIGLDHFSPRLFINSSTSYKYETPHDSGTGANQRSVILFDVALLNLTVLPAIAHDSFMFNDIEDSTISKIIRLYSEQTKQVFISFDNVQHYQNDTMSIIDESVVLKLSSSQKLFGRSWNVKSSSEYTERLPGFD